MLEQAKASGGLKSPLMVEVTGDPEQFSDIAAHSVDETTDAFHQRLREIALRWPGEIRPVICIGPERVPTPTSPACVCQPTRIEIKTRQ
jgi:hypothetical protein